MNTDKKDFLPVLLLLSLLAGCIEVDMSIPSFPDIARSLQASDGMVQRTITLNFFGFVIGALIYGPLSEMYGRRKVIILGSFLMLLGALGCVFAPNIDVLLLSRLIQGFGACAPVVIVFAVIADRYEGARAYAMFGLVNAFMSIVMAMAPVLGGWVNMYLGWRGNYAVVATIIFISFVMLSLFLPETHNQRSKVSFSSILSNYTELLKNRIFLSASLVPSLFFAAYMVFVVSSAFIYQVKFHMPIQYFVWHFFFIVASFAVTSLFSARLIQWVGGAGKAEYYGLFLSVFGSFLLWALQDNIYGITISMMLFCVGFALFYPVIFGRSMSLYPHMFGTVSAFNMSSRSLLVVLATALSSYVYSGEVAQVSYMMLACVVLALLAVFLGFFGKTHQEIMTTD